jgi:hypothetical protein
LVEALTVAARFVNDDLTKPAAGISNISEWAKKEASWTRIQSQLEKLEGDLSEAFWDELLSAEDDKVEIRDARKVQKIDNGIDAQRQVLSVPPAVWGHIRNEGQKRKMLTDKELGILGVAEQIPSKIPTEKQCAVLVAIQARAQQEGIV